MRIPAANLRPALEATAAEWGARLDELFARMHFILGEQGAAFERDFAAATGAPQVTGVGNGTAAIELCLRAEHLTTPQAQVLTSPLTAAFTGVGIRAAGAQPVFADVDPETLQLDPVSAGNRLGRRVRAILAVHLYGQPCPIDRFETLARERGLLLIQDAAQAHGARFRGRPLTSFSPYVTYSFYPTKNLGALGDAGAIATRSFARARRLGVLRDGGRDGGMTAMMEGGINSRLDEMQACYLRAFLPRLNEWNAWRARIAALYDQALAGCPGLTPVKRNADSVHHLYVVRARRRERLRAHLAGLGIGTGVHYPVPLHLQPAFRDSGLRRGDLPHAERACREVLSLPLWPYLPESAALEVAEGIRAFYAS